MPSVPEVVDAVFGVDSHRDRHYMAHLDAVGAVITQLDAPTNHDGYDRLLEAARHGCDGLRLWAIEGCGSYAAGLVRHLHAAGEWVVEVERPARPKRTNAAKTDPGDAVRAAREILGRDLDELAGPRHGETRDGLAVLVAARRGAVDDAADAMRELHAAIIACPETLRSRFHGLSPLARMRLAASLRPSNYSDTLSADYATALVSIAARHRHNTAQAAALTKRITGIVTSWRPDLLEQTGIGPIVAAVVLCAWSHPERFRSEAAFAMLAGTAPIPTGSGLTANRHRLNPAGDRQLNRHIHTIALTRLRCDPATIAYRDRRRAQGKTDREIRRCIKRYITRQLFRQLQHPPTT